MCTRVQRLLLILSGVAALAAARPAEVSAADVQPEAAAPADATKAVEAAVAAAGAGADVEAARSKRGILFSTHGYPGLVYPSLGYPYPGYFDLRYPSLAYPGYPALTTYPTFSGYPVLYG
ncbi:hypothetical protein R5R35_012582 [Gryllus longicercus]|uniref:Accessory gland protein n=1 Tax=Gryllus longicercus TaxID=2509291 RepID=A0AAN9VM39_9ORTH